MSISSKRSHELATATPILSASLIAAIQVFAPAPVAAPTTLTKKGVYKIPETAAPGGDDGNGFSAFC
jgi:hypothetical protein